METIGTAWRRRLKTLGFTPQGTGGRRGTYGARKVGPLSQAVAVLVDEGGRDGAFNVQLNLNMTLPASEPSHDVVVVLADLSSDGVRIEEPWAHEPGFATWWSSTETEQAWKAFEDYGVPWFDDFGRTEAVIAHFEGEYQRLDGEESRDAGGWIRRTSIRLGLAQAPRQPPYEQYLLWLSMLYGAVGHTERAVELLDAYAEWVRGRGIVGEMERLTRHRALLTA